MYLNIKIMKTYPESLQNYRHPLAKTLHPILCPVLNKNSGKTLNPTYSTAYTFRSKGTFQTIYYQLKQYHTRLIQFCN